MTNKIYDIVEHQVAQWYANQRQPSIREPKSDVPPNVVTVSSQYGAGGTRVALRLGELLEVPVYDREIVQHIASDEHVRVSTVETLDQKALSRIDDYLIDLFRGEAFDQHDYKRGLVHALLLLWHLGPDVLVGHGAVHVVPREHALAVRIVAKDEDRIARVSDSQRMNRTKAAKLVSDIDKERDAFSQHYFDVDIDAPDVYDLVINTSFVSPERAAKLIAHAYEEKFSERAPEVECRAAAG